MGESGGLGRWMGRQKRGKRTLRRSLLRVFSSDAPVSVCLRTAQDRPKQILECFILRDCGFGFMEIVYAHRSLHWEGLPREHKFRLRKIDLDQLG